MAYRSLFIPALDAGSLAGAVADAGVMLGDGPGVIRAHFVVDDYRPPVSMADAVNLNQIVEAQRTLARRLEKELHTAFDDAAAKLPGNVQCTFRSAEGEMPRAAALASRLCEAILYRHRGAKKKAFDPMLIEELLFRSGRPLVLVPPSGLRARPDVLAVAWNGSAEATRAVALAQPLLRQAKKIFVVTIGREQTGTPSAEDMAAHFNDCGTEAEVLRGQPGGSDGKMLADIAIEAGAKMMVLGAYSRSRLREVILGGVTKSYLEEPPLPLLIAR
ncbi:universal stress protein [Parvularcula lutaonensis]|uniref:Universal stress protein n=1 Tax=Parvularcula lutaonensis TaxID=491923 RepID=A0ABV7M9N0_9PROT|nr:universal stress protein [Parvularcula lutaonensis]GGY43741.1 universal stress protein UspA [Parvularcula lutaonensis]